MMRLLTPYWQNQHFAADIFNELDRRPTAERFAAPAYEVQENEQHYLIETDLPGVKKEDIKIDLHENILTISGERKRDAKAESFKRSFTLPESVDVEKATKMESSVFTYQKVPRQNRARLKYKLNPGAFSISSQILPTSSI